jgi:hypothetical protein
MKGAEPQMFSNFIRKNGGISKEILNPLHIDRLIEWQFLYGLSMRFPRALSR